jgi:hypothetical protein
MKKHIAILSLAAPLFGTWSHASERPSDVECSEKFIDHGLVVTIQDLPAEGTSTAEVSENTFAGTLPIGRFDVNRPPYPHGQPAGAELLHRSADGSFRLDLALQEPAGPDKVHADGTLRVVVESDGRTRTVEGEMFCTIFRNER